MMTQAEALDHVDKLRSSKELAHELRRLAGKDRSDSDRLTIQAAANALDLYRDLAEKLAGIV